MIRGSDVAAAWRYSVQKDYTSPTGSIEVKELHLTDQIRSIPVEPGTTRYMTFSHSLNADETILSINSGSNIHLYNLEDGTTRKLNGHTSDVSSVAFSPGRPSLLVSTSEGDEGGRRGPPGKNTPEIIIWDISDSDDRKGVASEAEVERIAGDTISFLEGQIEERSYSLRLTKEERKEMRETIDKLVSKYQTARLIDPSRKIHGRLCVSFDSPVFDKDGTRLIYLPGNRPNSNGDDTWDIVIRDLTDGSEMVLPGHRDAIMGIKYSPDQSVIVSIGWDGTFTLWEAETGEIRHVWKTDMQNWAGVFSPDSKWFLGTDGHGTIRIWNVKSGEKTWEWKYGHWCRAVDWSNDGRWIVVGGQGHARIVIFEVTDNTFATEPTLVHERILGNDFGPDPKPELKNMRMSGHFNEVNRVRILPASAGGCKFVSTCSLDKAIEVYDLELHIKWRIFPGSGVEEYGDRHGFHWSERTRELVTVGKDAIRFWRLD